MTDSDLLSSFDVVWLNTTLPAMINYILDEFCFFFLLFVIYMGNFVPSTTLLLGFSRK